MTRWLGSLLLLPALATLLAGQSAADSAAIRQAALDYAEGWYAGDGVRMERALHPELAKRIVWAGNGAPTLGQMGAVDLIRATASGAGTGTPEGERRADVRILDIFAGVAMVRVDMRDWVDFMQIAQWGDRWVIVNVLWQMRPQE